MTPLTEQYRPRTWSDVVGQEKVLRQIQILARRGLSGRYYWISGASGTGKTTIAYLIAREIAHPTCIQELDASVLNPSRLVEIESDMHYFGPEPGGRVYIINEAHGLSRPAIRQLNVLYDRLPSHVAVIFTTTSEAEEKLFEEHEEEGPVLSRCTLLRLSRQGLCRPFAERARQIAQTEGLDGQPIEAYERLLKRTGNNLRAALQAVESGAMLE